MSILTKHASFFSMPRKTLPLMVKTNNLKKFTKKGPRRRKAANTTKIKYEAPTARNQKKQIMSNAFAIKKLYKMALPKQVYCDWQYVGQARSNGYDPAGFTKEWFCFPLTDFANWGSCLRKDLNVDEGSTTYVRNMSINMRFNLLKSNYCQYNVWIVTSRRDASNLDWPLKCATPAGYPIINQQYIEGPNAWNLRLNPALFKVHYASYKTLTDNTLTLPADPAQTAGDPWSTWGKAQVNLACKINVRKTSSATGADPKPWTTVPYMQQSYYKRYFMLVCMVATHPTTVGPGGACEFTFDSLATTINSS